MAKAQQKKVHKKKKGKIVQEKPINLKGYWIFLGLVSFLLFANTLSHGYNMDDNLVTKNHKLTSRGFEAIGEIFKSPYHSDEMGYQYGYRPITHLSFAIEHQLFGESAKTSHTINVLLFAICVILLFQLIIRWMGKKSLYLALIAALLFAVHPIHSEVVASIKNRDEILAFLFAILSGLALNRFANNTKLWWFLLLGSFYFTVGMLAKKSIFPLVFVFPIAASVFSSSNWKKNLLIAASIAVPAALIAAEDNTKRLLLMTLLPLGTSFVFHYTYTALKSREWRAFIADFFQNKTSILIGLLISTGLVVLTELYLLSLLSIPFVVQLIKKDERNGMLIFVCQLVVMSILLGHNDFSELGFFLLVGYTIYSLKNGVKDKLLISLSIAAIIIATGIELYEDGLNWKPFARNTALLFFIYSFFYFRWISILYLGLAATAAHVWFGAFENDIGLFFLFLIVSAIVGLIDQIRKAHFVRLLPFILLVTLVVDEQVASISYRQGITQKDDMSWVYKEFDTKNQGRKEGRKLEYVENTLVAPHSNSEKYATGIRTMGEYARLMFFPNELSFYYGYAKMETTNFSDFWVWISLLFHIGLVILAIYFARSKPIISIGVVWYLLSIILFSNLVTYIAGMVGERLAFTASAGMSILIAGVIIHFQPNFKFINFKKAEIIVLIVFVSLAGRTFIRNKDWVDPITLMSRDIEHLDNSAQANNLLALNLMEFSTNPKNKISEIERKNMQEKAVSHFSKATEIWPYFFNAHFDKGRAAMLIGETETAISGFEKVIEIDPKFMSPYFYLFDIYRQTNDNDSYIRTARKLYNEFPTNKEAINYMFNGYFYNQQQDSALIIIEKALEAYPNDENYINTYNSLRKD